MRWNEVPLQRRLAGALRLSRATLLGATTLQAAGATVLAWSAAAQPAPNARPMGGVVSAGSASIGYAGNTTAISQASQRAAIDWESFNVGATQRVEFHQPSATATTLNTVNGPDPSQIAGRIDANGQIIIANRSGVVFSQGAEVNAQSLVVSAAGISRQNFMAGKMVLDQTPQPGARIVNQGSITVKQAGLAAFVAPQVANSGVITAKFGHVVLAGAEAATLDLYGDGLVSIDVSRAAHKVRNASGQTATALVTNTGAIIADGGTVQLTAAAADGVISNLVDARGTIRADTVNGHAGTIAINGTGGSILIAGNVEAEGKTRGSAGGAIELNASRAVTLSQNARVSVSGDTGGGLVAVGTTLARAAGGRSVTAAMTAKETRVRNGATITADATRNGNGGRITVLSTERTNFAGTISARGGASGGNGGTVEISSGQDLRLTGGINVCAPHGACGDILIDPANLTIDVTGTSDGLLHGGDPNLAFTDGGTIADATITPAAIQKLFGNVHLQATDNITVAANVTLSASPSSTAAPSLELEAGGSIRVNANVSISVPGDITFIAASTSTLVPGGGNPAAGIFFGTGSSISGNGTLHPFLSLTSGTGGISFGGNIDAGRVLIHSTGDVTQPSGTVTITTALFGESASLTMAQKNGISQVGSVSPVGVIGYSTTSGSFTLTNAPGQTLAILGAITVPTTAHVISISCDTVNFEAASALTALGGTVVLAPVSTGRAVQLASTNNPQALSLLTIDLSRISADTLRLGSPAAGQITLGTAGETIIFKTIGTLDLRSGAGVSESANALSVGALSGRVEAPGSATLSAAGNAIGTLETFTTSTGFALKNGADLSVAGPVSDAVSVSLNAAGNLAIAGSISAPTVALGATGAITEPGGAIIANAFSGSAASAVLTGPNSVANITQFFATGTAGLGPFAFNDTRSLLVSGTVFGDLSISTPGDLTINKGLIESPGTVALTVGGAITEVSGGHISADVLTGSAGSATLDQPNFVSTLGRFATGTGFDFLNSGSLTVTGPVTDGTRVAITSDGPLTVAGNIAARMVLLTAQPALVEVGPPDPATGSITQTGGQVAGGTEVGLFAAGTIAQAGGLIVAGLLTGNSGGSTTLSSAINAVASLGDFTSGGNFALATSGDLALTGALTAPSVTLLAAGAISQPSGAIATTTLSGAGGSANFALAVNSVATLGDFTSRGDFLLMDAATLTVAGTVTAGAGRTLTIADNAPTLGATGLLDAPAGTVVLRPLNAGTPIALGGGSGIGGNPPVIAHELVVGAVDAGPITIGGAFNLTQVDVLNLISAGAIAESGAGAVAVPVLAGQGASATLGAANAIGSLASFTTSGGLALTNGAGLTVAGPLTDSASVNLNVAGNLAIAGSITAPAVALTATGAISQPAGSMIAGGLTGSGASAALLGTNAVATLGNFTTTGGFALADTIPLTLQGTLTAGSAAIEAPGITLAVDSLVLGSGGASLTVLPDATGRGTFRQTGTTVVAGTQGGGTSLSVELPAAGGVIAFNNLAAPSTGLVLATGAGTASGLIDTGSLLVVGNTGGSNLFGIVAAVPGPPGAAIARIRPQIDPHYLLNRCVIEVAVCFSSLTVFPNPALFNWEEQNDLPQLPAETAAAILTLPPVQVVRQPRSPDIELPNISNLDY